MQIIYSDLYIKRSFFKSLLKLSGIGIGLILFLFQSCKTEDFDLQKFSTSNLKPKMYFPLAYGSYTIEDYLPFIPGADDQIITVPEIQMDSLTWRKGEFSLQPNAMDQASLEITVTNGSPMKTKFEFSFIDFYSGITNGRTFPGEVNPATSRKFVFPLTYDDLAVIKTADGLKCKVALQQPASGSGITLGSIKKSQFNIQINFTSGIYLGRLN